jgi:MoaA/NifB/PqqE/SkfB family radical SAM enzyme
MNRIDTLGAPLFVSWQLTRDCDLACLHCCTDSAPNKHLSDEFTADEAMRFAAEIVRAEIPYVMLCGGEPLRVRHFLDIAEYLGQAGTLLKIETNGQLLDSSVVDRLARLPIRSIQISLDADTEEVYARQRPGASLARAHDACRMVRHAGLPLEVTFAPTRLNIHQIAQVIERARELGAFRVNTGRLMRIGRAARLWHKIAPSEADYALFRETIAQQAQFVDGIPQLCYEPFSVAAGLQQSFDTPPATLLVLPNGLVKIVGAVGLVCGDLRRMTLAQAWESYRAAWHNETVIAAIRRGIAEELSHADANVWTSIPNGVLEKCSM